MKSTTLDRVYSSPRCRAFPDRRPSRNAKLILAAMQDKRTGALARLFDENRERRALPKPIGAPPAIERRP